MNELRIEQFSEFFAALYQDKATGEPYSPMTWQSELAASACRGQWPDYICVPTGAGKTSTIDIAVFALAFQADLPPSQRTAAMRTFLVVDRRTVVSEAFYRARELSEKLAFATGGILKVVADRLRSYTTHDPSLASPLDVVELRGGIYRDPAWCNSFVQPMVIASTVDQVGSRLLFRGYGISRSARPIQAAAVAHDSLIILDEAHISPTFSATLAAVQKYQDKPWASDPIPLRLQFVQMTATPPNDDHSSKLEISKAELADRSTRIGRIVNTSKPATLEVAEKAKGAKAPLQLAAVLADRAVQAAGLHDESGDDGAAPKVVGIMCNMVATAKEVWSLLQKHKKIEGGQVDLIIGAMRPIDRDSQTETLRRLISTGADRNQLDQPRFVVATQCIEVGADYDFDVLVTEAAPIDSLIQRFGRLNRSGREIATAGHIVIRGDRIKDDQQLASDDAAYKFIDPIYGNAMSYTWNWLAEIAVDATVDFGIATIKAKCNALTVDRFDRLRVRHDAAPVLLPAHLNLLCQTNEDIHPDPDVSIWLHGPQRNDPEVKVCWRADLTTVRALPDDESAPVVLQTFPFSTDDLESSEATQIHAVSLCPPAISECLSIPLRRVKQWLNAIANRKRLPVDESADVPAIAEVIETNDNRIPLPFRPVAWRGLERSKLIRERSQLIRTIDEIQPNDTLVFPTIAGGWTELGFVPGFHDWSPKSANGNLLATELQNAAESGIQTVECDQSDFDKLRGLDKGNEAFKLARQRRIQRIHPGLIDSSSIRRDIFERLKREPDSKLDRATLEDVLLSLERDFDDKLLPISQVEYYADRSGLVVLRPLAKNQKAFVMPSDDGSDLYSQIIAGKPVELAVHLEHVKSQVTTVLEKLPLNAFECNFAVAAETHDWGKADPRFQALLIGGDLYSAMWEPTLYAKSAKMPANLREYELARIAAELPRGFRHELLSMSLVERAGPDFAKVECRDLLLHLIASHHGRCRPWPDVCDDPEPPSVSLDPMGISGVSLSDKERAQVCYHHLNTPIVERFWKVTSKHGWWGIAYLEAILRLADQRASQIESWQQANNIGTGKEAIA